MIARYATRVNGVTDFFVTKLDVLSTLDKVPVCVAYEVDGKRYDEIPMTQTEFHHAKPVYEYLDGWWEDISQARSSRTCPERRADYVRTIEEHVRRPGQRDRRRPAPRPDAASSARSSELSHRSGGGLSQPGQVRGPGLVLRPASNASGPHGPAASRAGAA